MRPLEMLLAGADAAALVALWGLPNRWGRLAWLAAPLAAASQLAFEGWRWQLFPAYALAGAALAGGTSRPSFCARRRWARRIALGLGSAALAIAVALPWAFPVFRFPPPTGPHRIGTLTYHWVDRDRPELFTGAPGDRRELMAQIWYPARAEPTAPRARYVPDAAALAPLARLLGLPGFALAHLGQIETNAVQAAPVDGDGRYPVLVFAHGRGGYRQHNTWQIEELVSHGYAVAAIDQPYAAAGVVFPDGHVRALDRRMLDRRFEDQITPYLARDASFALSQLEAIDRDDPRGILTGRLDLQRAGLFGLSLGGETAGYACLEDRRFKACLAMDAWMPADVAQNGLSQPVMWISRDAATMRREGWAPADVDRTLDTMRATFDRSATAYLVLVSGLFHVDFSDAPLLSPLTGMLGMTGSVPAARGHAIVTAYTLAFFDRHLRGLPAPLLDEAPGASAEFPEVGLERRQK